MKKLQLISFLLIAGFAFSGFLPVAQAADYTKVVVFAQGLGTGLGLFGNENTFDTIKNGLIDQGFLKEQFLEYSYLGGFTDGQGNWHPYPYICTNTGQALQTSTDNLVNLVSSYHISHPDTKFVILGHSLGGLVGTRFLQAVLNGQIPKGTVTAIITLDSPLRGIPQFNENFYEQFSNCPGLIGSQVGIDVVNLYTNLVATDLFNYKVVALSGTSVYTLGNNQDCIYDTKQCLIPGIDWTASQEISSANWTLYDLGNDLRNLDFGHKRILDDPQTVSDIVSLIINN